LIVGLLLFVTWSLRSRPPGKIWLMVSSPVFGTRTNADGIIPTVSLYITNTGPRRLEYWVWWLECRERTDLAPLATNTELTTPASYSMVGGSTKQLIWDLLPGDTSSEGSLFCCQVHWHEGEPALWRLGRNLEPHASRILELFDSQAVAPWNSPSNSLAKGTVFVSNIDVAEYFRLAHGWTRESWLENLRQYEVARTQKVVYAERYARGPTAEEMISNRARSAFVDYCQSTTNAVEQTVQRAAPDAIPGNR
jgi:hypothetical protein